MGKPKRQNTSQRRALSTYVKLMRASESITTRVSRHLSDVGLTVSQFGVLEALYHLGPLSQKEIGQKILRSGGNITMVINNLEKRKLVKRKQNPEDRRIVFVNLTAEGLKLIRRIFPQHALLIKDKMNVLTDVEMEMLGEMCKKLGMRNT